MNIKNFKLSNFLILLLVINLIAILTKSYLIKSSQLETFCETNYEILAPKYNKHIDEIISGGILDHILRTIPIPKKNYTVLNSKSLQIWNVTEKSSGIECAELKENILKHLSNLNENINTNLRDFKNIIFSSNSSDTTNLKIATIIDSKFSFLIMPDYESLKIIQINETSVMIFEFLSKLIFFNIVYIFFVTVFFVLRKKFFSPKLK